MNKFASTSIIDQTEKYVNEYFGSNPSLIVGVSGGPDSMALLYLLYKLNIEVFVVHINYGLRAEDSDLDQELVEGMCSEWGIDCWTTNIDSAASSGNFQSWARETRYNIFEDFKREMKLDGIATAHHLDDQIETVFHKIMRGASPSKWKGMGVWEQGYFRPLLPFTKEEILYFCDQYSIPYRVDQTNLDSKYARNFFRNELTDRLTDFYPGWKDNLLGLKDYAQIFDSTIENEFELVVTEEGIKLQEFLIRTPSLQKAILKKYVEDATSVTLTKGILHSMIGLIDSQIGKRIPINDQFSLLKEREYLVVSSSVLEAFSEYQIHEEELNLGRNFNQLHINLSSPQSFSDQYIQLDAMNVSWPLSLRNWQDGDRFQPLGMVGSQKISDHMTNKKIAHKKRNEALILNGSDGTIYALIYPDTFHETGVISESMKVTSKTTKVIRISMKELQ